MPQKPPKKFLPSDDSKPSFRKSGRSRFNSRDGGGRKYGSKTFRPSEEGAGDDFQDPPKRKRGVGGSNNQGKEFVRGKTPLYSTGKKRPSRDEKPLFREVKDHDAPYPRGRNQDGFGNERERKYTGDGEIPKPPSRSRKGDDFSRGDKPRPFLKKDSDSKFPRRRNEDEGRDRGRGRREDNFRS